jgi:hypothetical protein
MLVVVDDGIDVVVVIVAVVVVDARHCCRKFPNTKGDQA